MKYTSTDIERAGRLDPSDPGPLVRVTAFVPLRHALGVDRLVQLGAAPYVVIRGGGFVSGYDVRVTRQDVIRDALAWWVFRHGRYIMRSKAARAARVAAQAERWNPIDHYLSGF